MRLEQAELFTRKSIGHQKIYCGNKRKPSIEGITKTSGRQYQDIDRD
jgi:hypothetical protein